MEFALLYAKLGILILMIGIIGSGVMFCFYLDFTRKQEWYFHTFFMYPYLLLGALYILYFYFQILIM